MKVLLTILMICYSTYSFATNYYVKNSGSDSNTGLSDGQAWQTISHVNAQTFSPGDTIFFKKGDTWRETLTVPSSGTSGNFIVFTSYGTGNYPIILGSEQAITWTLTGTANVWQSATPVTDPYAGGGNIFFLATDTIAGTHKIYIDLSELTQEYDWTWNANTLYVYTSTDPDSRYNSIEAAQRASGVDVNGNDHLEFNGIKFFFCLGQGIHTTTNTANHTGLIIRYIVSAFHGYHNGAGYGVTACFNDQIIEHSKFHDLGRRGVSVVNYSNYNIKNIIVQNNIFYNGFHTTGPDIETGGSGWGGNTDSVTIRNNLIYEDEARSASEHTVLLYAQGPHGGSGEIHNLFVYNNILKFMVGPAFQMEDVDTAFVYNNTFYDVSDNPTSATYQLWITDGATEVTVKNNIFYCSKTSISNYGQGLVTATSSIKDANHNLYYRINNSLPILSVSGTQYYMTDQAKIISDLGWEKNGVFDNPDFVSSSDYHLQDSSIAIGRGTSVNVLTIDDKGHFIVDRLSKDFEGKFYNDPPSIGAFEGNPPAGPPPGEDIEQTVTVFPNPTTGVVHVILHGFSIDNSTLIRILDLAGRIIFEDFFENLMNVNANEVQIPFNVNPGLYIVQVVEDYFVMAGQRLVVIH